ncbi:hypothetical protein GCM10022224_060110 [Nonomuraea antimicrobica]|uniref:Uncharacterized protein n=1 Tax=Nonomuraea antimicrobica TaxID=561173 RepID=A0ABP7CG93_9ACTN
MWAGEPAFPEAVAFAHAAEVAFWSDRTSALTEDERRPALEAIRLFGERLRPVEYDAEILSVHAYHLPFPGLGLIERHGDAFAWRPLG